MKISLFFEGHLERFILNNFKKLLFFFYSLKGGDVLCADRIEENRIIAQKREPHYRSGLDEPRKRRLK
jgi:hypothetical protein